MPQLPSDDKRWKIVEATARRHGREPHALIETLHTVQECFGYLDETALRFVAGLLRVPLSRVYGAATFYHFFTLKPKGKHTCVVCTGTACYIKGAPAAAAGHRKDATASSPARPRPMASCPCSRRAAWARAAWRRRPSWIPRCWARSAPDDMLGAHRERHPP